MLRALRLFCLVLLAALASVGCDSASDDAPDGAFDLIDGRADIVLRADASALNSDLIDLDSLSQALPFRIPSDAILYASARLEQTGDSLALGDLLAGLSGGELVLVLPGGSADARQALSAVLTSSPGANGFDVFVDEQSGGAFGVDGSRVVSAASEAALRAMLRRSDADRLDGDGQRLIGKTSTFPAGLLVQQADDLFGTLIGPGAPIPTGLLPSNRAAIGSTFDPADDATVDATIWLEPADDSNAAALVGALSTLAALAAQTPDLDAQTRALLTGLSPVVDGRLVRIAVRLPLATFVSLSQ